MSFWSGTKPKGIKDADAILDYPVDFSDWLTDMADSYASYTITTHGGLVCDSSIHSLGVITPILSGGKVGTVASFTIRIVTSGGRTDDRTLWLKIVESEQRRYTVPIENRHYP
jgi:hypothetical protein